MIKFQQAQNRHTHSTKSTPYHSRKLEAWTCLLHCCLFIFEDRPARVVNPRLWFPASVTCPATATCFPPSNNYFIITEKPPDNLFRITDSGKWRLPWILKTVLRHWMETSVWKDGTFFLSILAKTWSSLILSNFDPIHSKIESVRTPASPKTRI